MSKTVVFISRRLKFIRKNILWFALISILLYLLFSAIFHTKIKPEPSTIWDTESDTWVATDDLGRSLPGYSEVGAPRQNKFVGIFYFTWHGQHGTEGPYDITKIISNNTDAMNNPNDPPWGDYGRFHHWGESQFGYYLSDDAYVIRKHAQMLSDAGVDTLILDTTNGYTYKSSYMAILSEYASIRANGGKTPQLFFITPFRNPTQVVETLYNDLYSQNLYSDLWFRWDDNKPLIMADPAFFNDDPTLQDFFCFRKPEDTYFRGGSDRWGWLSVYPQPSFYNNEQTTVGVAQNAVYGRLGSMSQPGAQGRSFHNGIQPSEPYPTDYGYNFAEQWERALDLDPEFVFVTGWNEWVAQRKNTFLGYSATNIFVDGFNQEFSRDIEPMKGGHGDNYYYQLVDYIRQYKGVRVPQNVDDETKITIDGKFKDWSNIKQEFRDDIKDTSTRCVQGWGVEAYKPNTWYSLKDVLGIGSVNNYINIFYTNYTGRNDFELMKVARDEDNIYFYVKTKENISSYTDDSWMRLFIKTDEDALNWKGYNYVINRTGVGLTTTILEQVTGSDGWNWSTVSSTIPYQVSGNEMEIAVPRISLGLGDTSEPFTIDFKWHDNMQIQGEVVEFTTNGDSAPNQRFNYRYQIPATD